MRPLGPVVLVAALLAAGCGGGYREPAVSAKDRMDCDAWARSMARPGSGHYKSVYARCIYAVQHPERGGG